MSWVFFFQKEEVSERKSFSMATVADAELNIMKSKVLNRRLETQENILDNDDLFGKMNCRGIKIISQAY